MTRINLISPKLLHTKHLVAEYRELPRVFGLVYSAEQRGLTPTTAKIPKQFCLGTGHVTFFYDKLLWLSLRFDDLVLECINRGFNIQHLEIPAIKTSNHWWNYWEPRPEDIALSAARIAERMPKH